MDKVKHMESYWVSCSNSKYGKLPLVSDKAENWTETDWSLRKALVARDPV